MKICPKCNAQLPDEASFCEKCGTRLDATITCPSCGKKIAAGSHFCMHCGATITSNAAASAPTPEPKKSHTGRNILLGLLVVVLAAGAYVGYDLYSQHQAKLQAQADEARRLELQDSIDQAQYEQQLVEEEEKQKTEHRVEDIKVFVESLYSFRGEFAKKIVRYYSSSLKDAYDSWKHEGLKGPQPILFEKEWEDGCDNAIKIRNYQKEVTEISSPEENAATAIVNVKFSLYNGADDDAFMEDDSHEDVFKLIYEGGEWKIDDYLRDGRSAKSKYRNGSAEYGKETCEL